MKSVNVHEAKTHLSRLLEEVEAGESLVIAKSGRPVARLVPFSAPERRPGRLRGRIALGAQFELPLPEDILAGFEKPEPGP